MSNITAGTNVTLPPSFGVFTEIGFILGVSSGTSSDFLTIPLLFGAGFLLIAFLVRIIMGNYPEKQKWFRYTSYFPEESITLLVGVVAAGIFVPTGLVAAEIGGPTLAGFPPIIIFFLLAPILYFRAGFLVPHYLFLRYLGTILYIGIIGTILIICATGFSIWGLAQAGLLSFEISFPAIMTFACAISLVTPGFVLYIMRDMAINEQLYILLLGEFTVGRGIGVVWYFTFRQWALTAAARAAAGGPPLTATATISGTGFGLSIGALLLHIVIEIGLGLVFAFVVCLFARRTKFTPTNEIPVIFLVSTALFFFCRYFFLSGGIALEVAGFLIAFYFVPNMSSKPTVAGLEQTIYVIIAIFSAIIFLLAGLLIVVINWYIDWFFTIMCFIFIYGYRFIVLSLLAGFRNLFYLKHEKSKYHLSVRSILCLWYTGTRGEIAFVLSFLVFVEPIFPRGYLLSTALIILLFNLFVYTPLSRVVLGYLGSKQAPPPARSLLIENVLLEDMLAMKAMLPESIDTALEQYLLVDEDQLNRLTVAVVGGIRQQYLFLRYYSLATNQAFIANIERDFEHQMSMIYRVDELSTEYFIMLLDRHDEIFSDDPRVREGFFDLMIASTGTVISLVAQKYVVYNPMEERPVGSPPPPAEPQLAVEGAPGAGPALPAVAEMPFSTRWRPFVDLLLRHHIVEFDVLEGTIRLAKDLATADPSLVLLWLGRRARLPRLLTLQNVADWLTTPYRKLAFISLVNRIIQWELQFRDRVLQQSAALRGSFASRVFTEMGAAAVRAANDMVTATMTKRYRPKRIIYKIALRIDAFLRDILVRPLSDKERAYIQVLDKLYQLKSEWYALKLDKALRRYTQGFDVQRLRIQERLDILYLRIGVFERFVEKLQRDAYINDKRVQMALAKKEIRLLSSIVGAPVYGKQDVTKAVCSLYFEEGLQLQREALRRNRVIGANDADTSSTRADLIAPPLQLYQEEESLEDQPNAGTTAVTIDGAAQRFILEHES